MRRAYARRDASARLTQPTVRTDTRRTRGVTLAAIWGMNVRTLWLAVALGASPLVANAQISANVSFNWSSSVPDEAVASVDVFYDQLSPYGVWIDDPTVGQAFIPEQAGYVPYSERSLGEHRRRLCLDLGRTVCMGDLALRPLVVLQRLRPLGLGPRHNLGPVVGRLVRVR